MSFLLLFFFLRVYSATTTIPSHNRFSGFLYPSFQYVPHPKASTCFLTKPSRFLFGLGSDLYRVLVHYRPAHRTVVLRRLSLIRSRFRTTFSTRRYAEKIVIAFSAQTHAPNGRHDRTDFTCRSFVA